MASQIVPSKILHPVHGTALLLPSSLPPTLLPLHALHLGSRADPASNRNHPPSPSVLLPSSPPLPLHAPHPGSRADPAASCRRPHSSLAASIVPPLPPLHMQPPGATAGPARSCKFEGVKEGVGEEGAGPMQSYRGWAGGGLVELEAWRRIEGQIKTVQRLLRIAS